MISKIKHILSLRPRSSKVFLTVEQQSEHFFPTTGQNKLGNKIPLFSPLLVSKLTMPLGSLSYIAFPVIMINILNLYGLVCVSALFFLFQFTSLFTFCTNQRYSTLSLAWPHHMVIQLWIIKKCCLLNYPTVNCFISCFIRKKGVLDYSCILASVELLGWTAKQCMQKNFPMLEQ